MKKDILKRAVSMLILVIMMFTTVFSSTITAQYEDSVTEVSSEKVSIIESAGWHESAYTKWKGFEGIENYNVYVKPEGGEYTKIDDELVRKYNDFYRADALGLAKGSYVMKVVPVSENGEIKSAFSETGILSVDNYVREGFAFSENSPYKYTTGAYNKDGTLQADADVIYVSDENKDTVTVGGDSSKGVGLVNILNYRSSKKLKTPMAIRFIGKVTMPSGVENYMLSFQNTGNMTVEGIGEDATIHGWGLTTKRVTNFEVRNIGIMWYGGVGGDGDSLSLDTENKNIFMHNIDFFYGAPGKDSDQAKGDGSIDLKSKSDYITASYNHFWDSGKSCVAGGVWESKNPDNEEAKIFVTYHHNWFDHSDSRHPRCVAGSVHVYNNYYDGVAKYGIGAAVQSSVFAENNYFRNVPRPMIIATQGSDVYENGVYKDKGTLSGQTGGMIKAYGNVYITPKRFVDQNTTPDEGQIDAYTVTSRNEKVPDTIKAMVGGHTYNNFDTDEAMYEYNVESAENAVETVKKQAGRMNGGDFKWTFTEEDDPVSDVDVELQNAIINYEDSITGLYGTASKNPQDETTEQTTEKVTVDGTEVTTKNEDITTEVTTNDTAVGGSKVHNFTINDKNSDFYSIEGDLSTGKGTVVYNGLTLTKCLKMGSSTLIKFNSESESTLTLVFNPENASCNCKIDGVKYVADEKGVLTVKLAAGEHQITKQDSSSNLFYISLDVKGVTENTTAEAMTATESTTEETTSETTTVTESTTEETTGETTTVTENTTESTTGEQIKLYGDADDNGKIEIVDVVSIMRYISDGIELNNTFEYIDVNKDGKINTVDAAMVLQNVLNGSYDIGNNIKETATENTTEKINEVTREESTEITTSKIPQTTTEEQGETTTGDYVWINPEGDHTAYWSAKDGGTSGFLDTGTMAGSNRTKVKTTVFTNPDDSVYTVEEMTPSRKLSTNCYFSLNLPKAGTVTAYIVGNSGNATGLLSVTPNEGVNIISGDSVTGSGGNGDALVFSVSRPGTYTITNNTSKEADVIAVYFDENNNTEKYSLPLIITNNTLKDTTINIAEEEVNVKAGEVVNVTVNVPMGNYNVGSSVVSLKTEPQNVEINGNIVDPIELTITEVNDNVIVTDQNKGYVASYDTIQDALTSETTNGGYTVNLMPGLYEGNFEITKAVTLTKAKGEEGEAIIYGSGSGIGGNMNGTVRVASDSVTLKDITVLNNINASYGGVDSIQTGGTPGAALISDGDGSVFENCKFVGVQDTINTRAFSSSKPLLKQTFNNCVIYGATDVICGSGIIDFNNCEFKVFTGDLKEKSDSIMFAPSAMAQWNVNGGKMTNDEKSLVKNFYYARAWESSSSTTQTLNIYAMEHNLNIGTGGLMGFRGVTGGGAQHSTNDYKFFVYSGNTDDSDIIAASNVTAFDMLELCEVPVFENNGIKYIVGVLGSNTSKEFNKNILKDIVEIGFVTEENANVAAVEAGRIIGTAKLYSGSDSMEGLFSELPSIADGEYFALCEFNDLMGEVNIVPYIKYDASYGSSKGLDEEPIYKFGKAVKVNF